MRDATLHRASRRRAHDSGQDDHATAIVDEIERVRRQTLEHAPEPETCARDCPLHRPRRLVGTRARARRPPLAGAARAARRPRSGGSSRATAAASSTRLGTASSRASTARRARSAARSAITGGVRELGLEVRAGVHTGECERHDGKIAGIAVSTGARVAACGGRRRSARLAAPSRTSSPARGSRSRTVENTS